MTDGKMITTRGSLEWWERLIKLFLRIFLLIMLCLFLQRKIHRQSTSDNERGGKSWAGMILISCTFPKYVGLLACTCFCISRLSRVINPSAALVYSQLVCLPPVGIFKHVMFHLQYLFRLFVKCSALLAICYKHLPRVNKGYLIFFYFFF